LCAQVFVIIFWTMRTIAGDISEKTKISFSDSLSFAETQSSNHKPEVTRTIVHSVAL